MLVTDRPLIVLGMTAEAGTENGKFVNPSMVIVPLMTS
jgi:hypothetical protein